MGPYHYFVLLAAAVNIAIAFYVWSRKPRHAVHQAFLLFVCGIAVWSAGISLLSATRYFLFDKVIFIGGMTGILGLFLFARVFPDHPAFDRKTRWYMLPMLLLFGLLPFNLFIKSTIIHGDGSLQPVNGPLFPLMVATLAGYILGALTLMVRHYRRSAGLIRRQMQYVFLGFGLFMVTAFIADDILPAFGIFQYNFLGPVASIVLVAVTAYSIIKHQLLDIRVVIQRGLIFFWLFTAVVGLYWGLLGSISWLLHRTTTATVLASSLTVTVLGAFGVRPLEKYFRKLTDRWFYKDPYDYAAAMQTLSSSLNDNLDLDNLMRAVITETKKIFKVDNIALITEEQMLLQRHGHYQQFRHPGVAGLVSEVLIVPDRIIYREILQEELAALEQERPEQLKAIALFREIFQDCGFELWVRVATPQKGIGFLALGRKKSGDGYTRQDEQLLETFSHQAAVAIEKAVLYERLLHRAGELEQAVTARTTELRQLHDNQSRVMTNIAHALQSPLAVMKSELQAAKYNPSGSQVRTLEKNIDEVSKRIYDLLRLARMEIQEEAFRFEHFDLSELVEAIAEYVYVVCGQNNIQFTSAIAPGIRVYGDRQKLEELVNNLLSNAIKYISNERTVHLELLALDIDAIELRVKDSGIGIDLEILPHVFERFYRANIVPGLEGLGVGLAICKSIAERHGGAMSVTSQPGAGSTFIFRLPVTGRAPPF